MYVMLHLSIFVTPHHHFLYPPQGLNASVETVRLLNVVLKISGDNLARCGNVLTEVRGEDAHSVQMIEQMQVGLGFR